MSLIDRARRTIQREQLATGATRVVAALSGGPDSVALVRVLQVLHERAELQFVAIAHLNHQLRHAADGDAQFCAAIAERAHLPFSTERVDVRALASAQQRSLEAAAHDARYAFFERALQAHGADVVAVGHTRDDQAETFLLRLLRGAGSRGLSAMHPRSGPVIRPLLDCSRDDVRAFLLERKLSWVHDATNDDVGIPRNRVRSELLPLLAERFNPRIVDVLAAEAELARADQQFLDGVAEAWVASNVRMDGSATWRLEAGPLVALPRAVGSRVLRQVLSLAAAGRLVGFADVRRAWAVAAEGATAFDGPGQRVQRVGPDVVLSSRPAGSAGRRPVSSTGQISAFRHPLPIPGEVPIPEIGCVMSAEVAFSVENASPPNGVAVVVPKEKVAGGLAVRNRRPGDRLMPSPAGHRKLQDLFVDRKVPREERDRIPIVVAADDDRIVWVAGHAVDQDFRVTDSAQAVVILRLKGVGGSC